MKKTVLTSISISFALFSITTANAQAPYQITEIVKRSDVARLNTLYKKLDKKYSAELARARAILAKEGKQEMFQNADGSLAILHGLNHDGTPKFFSTSNVAAAITTRTNFVQPGGDLQLGLQGEGMNIFVWDTPNTLVDHVEFDGPGGLNRVVQNDAFIGNSYNWHGTHVMGVVLAAGIDDNAKGMANHAKGYAYSLVDDFAEASQAILDYGMLISNHSYTPADNSPIWLFGAYNNDARQWDEIMNAAPYFQMVCAASNFGNSTTTSNHPLSGYGDIAGFLNAKNNLVVANLIDITPGIDGSVTASDIERHSTGGLASSVGPTDDLRIKPDIGGNGVQLYSLGAATNTTYRSETGTSFASPNVGGSLLLLQEHAFNVRGFFLMASTLKGLALHTADVDGIVGSDGPNPEVGWGVMNTKRAAEVISDNGVNTIMDELTILDGETFTLQVQANGADALQASISWNDPAGIANTGIEDDMTPVLVNDLDIRVTRITDNQVTLPWKLAVSGTIVEGIRNDNNVDPYERIDIVDHLGTANAFDTYEITVTHKGSLAAPQDFALIVTGATRIVTEEISIEVNDAGNYAPFLDIPVGCTTNDFTIQYQVSDDFCSNISALQTQEVGLKIFGELPDNISIIGGDGVHQFNDWGRLQFPASELSSDDVTVSVQFQVTGPILETLASYVEIGVDTDVSPQLGACSAAEVTLSHPLNCYGDMNEDGAITVADLHLFLNAFGSTNVDACNLADFNQDGAVTTTDLTGFLQVFGTFCNTTNSPESIEPSTLTNADRALIMSYLKDGGIDMNMSLYPNPASTTVQVIYNPLIGLANATLSVLDISGRVVDQQLLNESGKLDINMNEHSSGTYVIRITSDILSDSRILIKE